MGLLKWSAKVWSEYRKRQWFFSSKPPSPTDVISSDAVQKADNRHWAYSPVCSIWAPKGLYLYPKAFWSIPVPQAGWITVTMEWLVCIMQPLDICKPFEAYLFFKYWSMQANPESHIHMKRNGSWFNEELSLCLSLSLSTSGWAGLARDLGKSRLLIAQKLWPIVTPMASVPGTNCSKGLVLSSLQRLQMSGLFGSPT